jgi:hypothetical protein
VVSIPQRTNFPRVASGVSRPFRAVPNVKIKIKDHHIGIVRDGTVRVHAKAASLAVAVLTAVAVL